jgi:N-acetylmuramoyl-L-alanine amidase
MVSAAATAPGTRCFKLHESIMSKLRSLGTASLITLLAALLFASPRLASGQETPSSATSAQEPAPSVLPAPKAAPPPPAAPDSAAKQDSPSPHESASATPETAPAAPSLAPATPAGTPAQLSPPAAQLAPASTKNADCKRSAFKVVVDVGHTVDKPGADSARGVTEYSYNLRLAGEIQQALLDAGFDKTIKLITAAAPWRGLVERAERANQMHADLFISIHHDSVPDYLLQKWDFEGHESNFSDRFKGYAIFISNGNADPKGSLAFGHFLGDQMQARGLHFTPHYTLPLMRSRQRILVDPEAGVYRFDQLIVLEKTLMPAVLLEAGSIINRDEEMEMRTPERRASTSAAVAAAVEDFCAARFRVAHAPHPQAAAAVDARRGSGLSAATRR